MAEELKSMTGVLAVVRAPTDFWQGKADVAVALCGSSSIEVCAGRLTGGITDDQKRAILDRLHEILGVDAVYFEDRAHALEVARHYWPESVESAVLMADEIGESFYVKLNNPRLAEVVGRTLKDFPGVQGVRKIALN
ncbi:permease-like cell division protein FtsX [Microbispora sp. CA-102843]|uniref:permease-like cell division protein FtsX n=1 Tax=Microbispora sp. CA-102843 TaxID=3239952 RepID=UPI003D8BEAC0